jgi:HemY protein
MMFGGLLGALVIRDPGYVLLAYDDMAVETSLWFAVLLLIVGYFLLRALVFVLLRLGRGPVRVRSWSQSRRVRAAQRQTLRGLRLMAEGDWEGARNRLVNAAPGVSAPLVNYLNAARAAQSMGDLSDRDELLEKAQASAPDARLAVRLTQAGLQHSAGQWEQCLATLLQLQTHSPGNSEVLRLMADCYLHLQDWPALLELLPSLKKRKVLLPERLQELECRAWSGRLQADVDDIQTVWKQMPKDLRRQEALVSRYASLLSEHGDGVEAEQIVRATLNHHWSDELVRIYGTLRSEDARQQLVAAEGWLKKHPDDPDLLLALGRIAMMNHRWDKAREYFEASLRLRGTAEVQGELGRLCAALGDLDRGSQHLREALPALPNLPLPDGPEHPTDAQS